MKQKLKLILATLLVTFVLAEIFFSIIVDEDLDGNLSLNSIHIKPYQLPVLETTKKIDELTKNKVPDSLLQQYDGKEFKRKYFNSRLLPDSLLGWSPNLIFKSSDGLYIYNQEGIRSNDILADYSKKRKLRIAIFGDSFIDGSEVKYENTIGNYLESNLREENIDAEVLNFTLSGYGLDQAFVKWRSIKDEFKPDIVIIGIQFENIGRNVNLLAPLNSNKVDIPYSKPRFVLQGNKLQFISNPILDINKTVDIIERFETWELSHFEGLYSDAKYNPNFLYYSKTISFISSLFSKIFGENDNFNPKNESYQVTYKIFEMFQSSVEQSGEIFIPVHLPVQSDFDFFNRNFINVFYDQQFIYDDLFNPLKQKAKFVEPYDELEKWESINENNELFIKNYYSATANKIIANQIYNFLQINHAKLLVSEGKQK